MVHRNASGSIVCPHGKSDASSSLAITLWQIVAKMLFVIIAFSEHHLKIVLHQIGRIPVIGESIQQPIRDMLHKQKMALHRAPGTHVEQ
ncbi:hypothetical protein ANCCEY_14888, partial [Ancylostoma ceylanicum]